MATCLLLIAIALNFWGAAEIRSEPGEIFFLTLLGGLGLFIETKLIAWLGLSFRDDAVERRNLAALLAICGAVLAGAIIYAGASIGEGPSYSTNFFSAALGLGGFFLLWISLETGGRVSVSIAEERDLASGLRLAGFFLAIGLILARSVAGNWESEWATIQDFAREGWPTIAIWAIALTAEMILRPRRTRPFPSWLTSGLFPALVYMAIALS